MNENQRRFIEKRKENGLCVDCGKPLDRDGIRCVECRKRLNRETMETRHWYQDNHICPRCRKNSIMGDEKNCPECRAKATNGTAALRDRDRESYNAKQRILHKSIYQKRKEKGLCVRCGKRNADYGYFTCGICRDKGRTAKRIRYGKPDREDRYLQGLCYFCDNPVKPGYKVCEEHYQRNVENANSQGAKDARKVLQKTGILY